MLAFLPISLFLVLLIVDQLFKQAAVSGPLAFVCNTGMAFGFALPAWLLIPLAGVFLFSVGFFLFSKGQKPNNWMDVGLWLILAGGVSNILDRLIRGCVVDYLHLPWFPSFNLADIYLTLGAIALMIYYWTRERKNKKTGTITESA